VDPLVGADRDLVVPTINIKMSKVGPPGKCQS
jgi:hypothetical protein